MTTQAPQPTTKAATASQPRAGQGVGQTQAGAAAKAASSRRFLVPSAALLRVLRVVAAVACLAAGGIAAWVLTTTATNLDAINDGNQQVLRLQQIKGDVLRADGAATHALAQSSDPTGQQADYRAALAEAAKLTVEASNAQTLDAGDLASVNAGLVKYALTMERARTLYPSNNATGITTADEAGKTLRSDTVPTLEKLVAANTDRVNTAKAGDRLWAIALSAIPVILLVGISIWLARRTKRVLNIGLVVAIAASALLWQLVDTNLADAKAMMDGARAGSLQRANAAATAYAALADGRSAEGRALLQPSSAATQEAAWKKAIAQVDAATKTLGDQASTGAVDTYKKAHTALAAQLTAGKTTDARAAAAATTASALNPAYKSAATALTQSFTSNKTATAAEVSQQQTNLQFGFWIALLLGLLGAVASWLGIAQRLREYR